MATLRSTRYLALLTALIAGAWPEATTALDLSKVNLRPLLQVESTRLTQEDIVNVGGILYGGRIGSHDSVTVTRGGAVLEESASQSFELRPFQARYVRGIASPADLTALSTAMAAAKIGALVDCSLEEEKVMTGSDQIIWYGAGARWNSFRVFYGTQAIGAPDCSPELKILLEILTDLRERVENDSKSEVLTSR